MAKLTDKDRREFIQYLRQCTDVQVRGVFVKEVEALRNDYATLAREELARRNLIQWED